MSSSKVSNVNVHTCTPLFQFYQLFGTEPSFRANLLLGKPSSRGILYQSEFENMVASMRMFVPHAIPVHVILDAERPEDLAFGNSLVARGFHVHYEEPCTEIVFNSGENSSWGHHPKYGNVAPLWHQGTIAPRAPTKNKKLMLGKCTKANLSFEGVSRG